MLRGIFYLTDDTFRGAADAGIKGLLFVMGCLFAGVAIHFGSKKYHYPYTVGCFLFGVMMGLIEVNSSLTSSFDFVNNMNPREMLLLFLPILIFESSFGMDAHMFYRALPQCFILAVVGFSLCAILTAVFAKYALAAYGWSWLTALVFGIIVSATDPVAVVALLKEMKMPHALTVLIEGESLLNDGVAIVMYEMLTHQMISEKPFDYMTTFIELIKTCIGAPALGYLLGKLTECFLMRIYISPVSEMTTILVSAYVTYFVAEEILGISAVIAVVLLGVTLSANRMCISPESAALIHTDWRLLAVYANTLIFMIVGILVSASFSTHFSPLDAWFIIATYVILTILRSTMIAVFFPCLRKTGYGLSWKDSIVLAWGGLRGAIGLALSLMLASNPHIPESANAKKVLIQVSGIIVLTLIINANSVKLLMKIINFKEITLVNRLSMGNAIASVSEIKEKSLRTCRGEWKLMKANWEWVNEKTKLEDPYKGGLYGEDPNMSSLFVPYGTCKECMETLFPYEPSSEEMDELKEAARRKVLRALKGILWQQFRKGLIQRRSLRLLCMAVDNVSDHRDKYLQAEDVRGKYMRVSKLNQWLEIHLSSLIKRMKPKKDTEFELEMNQLKTTDFGGARSFCLWIYFSRWFHPLIFLVIISHVTQVVTDIHFAYSGIRKHDSILQYLTIFYIVFYILEIIIKVLALKWNLYIKLAWNKVDFVVSMLAMTEGLLDILLMKYHLHYSATHVRILVIVRTFRYHSVAVNIFVSFLSFIRNHASSELYYAYDIGRGFRFASDTLLKNIDVIVDFGPCAQKPIRVLEQNVREGCYSKLFVKMKQMVRVQGHSKVFKYITSMGRKLQMLDTLDEFERNYPAVAVALKTNRAARSILNRVQNVLSRLQKRSLVLDEDAKDMKLILFKMTKTVVFAPKARTFIRDVLKLLQDVEWIKPELSKQIYDNHLIVTYDNGDIIQRAGEKHEFVFVLARGIVRVIGERHVQEKESQYCLPNVDSPIYFQKKDAGAFYDYLTVAETIGLLGYLQKSPSLTSVVCQTDCELIQIEYSCLEDARQKFDDLMFCMWRSVAIKIGLHVLKKQYRYKSFTEEDILVRLEKAILPNLRMATSLEIPVIVEDVVIIQGHAVDARTGAEFTPPAYIPSSTRHLKLVEDVNRRSPVVMLYLLEKKYRFHHLNHWVDQDKVLEACTLYPIQDRMLKTLRSDFLQ